MGADYAARETETAGLGGHPCTLESVPGMTLGIEQVRLERKFCRNLDDEDANERATIWRRKRACARDGVE